MQNALTRHFGPPLCGASTIKDIIQRHVSDDGSFLDIDTQACTECMSILHRRLDAIASGPDIRPRDNSHPTG